MPKILESMVSQLKAKGHDKNSAWAIANSQLRKHGDLTASGGLTPQGAKREKMGHAGRVKARAEGLYQSGGPVADMAAANQQMVARNTAMADDMAAARRSAGASPSASANAATGSGGDAAGGVSGTGGIGGSATGGQGGSAVAGVSGQDAGGDDGGTYRRGGKIKDYCKGGKVISSKNY
jgi:hypothetical protein